MLVAFLPVGLLLSLAPGVATILVIRRAAVSGRRAALMTTVGNEIGVLVWAVSAGLGLAAVVAASAALFTVIKLVGAAVLIVMGVRALLQGSEPSSPAPVGRGGSPLRDGVITSIANPKLAVFYVALFPQFLPHGDSILLASCAMGLLLVVIDLVWYSVLATLVARAASKFLARWLRRAERLCGSVLIGLGVRLALEQR
jgi:threonine/homoserine/homoserine lactone efflux protein